MQIFQDEKLSEKNHRSNFWLNNNRFMENKNVSRKKFLAWSVGLSSLLAVPAFLKFAARRKDESTTVKMLTQDGRLVEIDVANIPSKRKKVKDAELHNWISRKKSL